MQMERFRNDFMVNRQCEIYEYPVCCWKDADCLKIYGTGQSCPVVEEDVEWRKTLEKVCLENSFPIIYYENEFTFYGLFKTSGEVFFGIGPVVRETAKPAFIEYYRQKHHLKESPELKRASLTSMTKFLVMLFCQCQGEEIQYQDIVVRSSNTKLDSWRYESELEFYQLEQSEYDREHYSGRKFELELYEKVRSGDIDGVKRMMGGMVPDMQMAGAVAKRPDKQSEYLTVVLVTLLSRAAIEGGADPEAAYELGDIYIRRVEMSSVGGGNFNTIGIQAACEFTEMVIKARKHTNDYHIDACKSYIAKNLRKDLKVGDIAPAIGISRTYLAHKFREAEGITVQEYILREKCGHAANMLMYSDYPISIIAEYFGFSSPSHFGNCFKGIYGMTPKAYRLKNFKN